MIPDIGLLLKLIHRYVLYKVHVKEGWYMESCLATVANKF